MSLATIRARATAGIAAPAVRVEVHLSGGLPALAIVGLPEAAVREARERVRSALINTGFYWPARRVTINLAPADLPKEGGRYDLAMAIGILVASGQLKPAPPLGDFEFLGELSLSGELRPVKGVLPAALAARRMRRGLVTPQANAAEATRVAGLDVYAADELPEFDRHVLEVLREPLESGRIVISRAARQAEFPARFQLIAAMNPCPCGYRGDPKGRCRCTPDQIARYRARISGPILDRIDLHVEVPRPEAQTLAPERGPNGEPSAVVAGRVAAARALQIKRSGKPNAALAVADLAGSSAIEPGHVAEAIGFRALDRRGV